jgi:hypothetical protein
MNNIEAIEQNTCQKAEMQTKKLFSFQKKAFKEKYYLLCSYLNEHPQRLFQQ